MMKIKHYRLLLLPALLIMLLLPTVGQSSVHVIIKGSTVTSADMDAFIPLPSGVTVDANTVIRTCYSVNYISTDVLVYDSKQEHCNLYADFINMTQPNIDNVYMMYSSANDPLPTLLDTIFVNNSKAVVLFDSSLGCVSIVGKSVCPPGLGAVVIPEGSGSSGGGGTTPTNHAPVASSQSIVTDQDTAVSITLVASDSDSNALTYSVVSQPANGTLSGAAPSLSYQPDANFSGADSFTFRANDGSLNSNIATVSITVNAVVTLPVITDLSARAKDGKISLVWSPVTGADSYHVYRSTTQGGPYQIIATEHVTDYATYLDQGLINGVSYYYVVTSISDGKESAQSNEASATPAARTRR